MTDDEIPTITVSAVVLRDDAGRVLTVRKRGTSRFMLVGGKPEPGETAAMTVVRECREETGLVLDEARLELLGTFTAPAANEAGHRVVVTAFTHPLPGSPHIAAEIEEVRWLDVSAPWPHDISHDLRLHVLPALAPR